MQKARVLCIIQNFIYFNFFELVSGGKVLLHDRGLLVERGESYSVASNYIFLNYFIDYCADYL